MPRGKNEHHEEERTIPMRKYTLFTLLFVVCLFAFFSFHSGFRLMKRHVKCQKYIYFGVSLIDFMYYTKYTIFRIIIVMRNLLMHT